MYIRIRRGVSLVILLFICPGFLIAQSKKEQIEILNFRVDSLVAVLSSERAAHLSRIQELSTTISGLEMQLEQLKADLIRSEDTVSSKTSENTRLRNELETSEFESRELSEKLIRKSDSLKLILSEFHQLKAATRPKVPENDYEVLSTQLEPVSKDVRSIEQWLNGLVLGEYTGADTSFMTSECLAWTIDIQDLFWGYDGSITESMVRKKWSAKFDLSKARFGHLFESGNGGWGSKKVQSMDYLGELNQGDWFKITVVGGPVENDYSTTLIRVVKVIRKDNRFYISNFISLSEE